MNKHGRRRSALALALAAGSRLSSGSLGAQTPPNHEEHRSAPAPLPERILGRHSWPITTASATAQAYFDQGLRLMYAYAVADARRAFEEARRQDPSCAMCWWGEAWSMGPYLNGGMALVDVSAADAAAERARALAAGATAVERAVIEALATRYAPTQPTAARRGLDS